MLERSAAMFTALRPASSIRASVSAGSERPARATSAPAWARATAMAWPMPVLAPVTSAVLPARLKEMAMAAYFNWQISSTFMSV
jgi:hypothetical protein